MKFYQDCIQSLKVEKYRDSLKVFELKILAKLGYEINLKSEFLNGEPIFKEKNIVTDWKVVLSRNTGFSGKDLIAIRALDFTESSLRVVRQLDKHLTTIFRT